MQRKTSFRPDLKETLLIITGAAGFIGSCLVRHLNDLGFSKLLLVDDLKKNDKWKNLGGKLFLDLISKHELFSYLEKGRHPQIGAIVHLGACSDTLQTDASYLWENNYRYSQHLAELALKKKLRFIFASSAATYGRGDLGFEDQEASLISLRPINMYAFSKHLFDLWCRQKKLFSKLVSLKFFNVFGPNEYHKGHMASMIFKMYKKALAGEPIGLFKSNDPKYPDGEQKRDFIYVKDTVRMIASFLFENRRVNGLFNVGTGRASSWNEVALDLFAALGQKPRIEYIEMPSDLNLQYQNFTQASMEKWQRNCGPLKLTALKEAIFDYVQNYLLKGSTW
ncbi:MAG: ADP-glyceromanno-heptose 6-epimerase [Parachlamydiales bacterium]|jgi:ADP-L-glycero-D-manno-heptose 6-epimerase